MKRPIIALAALTLCSAASAQPALSGNAAVDFWAGAYQLQRGDIKSIRDLDWSKVGGEMDSAKLPQEFNDAAAALSDDTVGMLIRASRQPHCDFQIQFDKGPFALLPHLGAMRDAMRALRVDARKHIADGDAAGAVERLVAGMHLARDVMQDRILISSLVGVAMINQSIQEAQAELDAGKLDDKSRQALTDAFSMFTGEDPFFIRAAVQHGERDLFVLWIKREFHGATAGKDLVATRILDISTGAVAESAPAQAPAPGSAKPAPAPKPAPSPPPPAHRPDELERLIAGMNEAQLGALVDLLVPFYDQAASVWNDPDADQKLKGLSAKADSGGFGPLGSIFAPALTRCHDSDFKARAQVRHIIEQLSK
jgi:hypothetical protein